MSTDKFSERYINFKNHLTKVNLNELSKQELTDLLQEAKEIEVQYNNTELVVKCDANSLYGSSASKYFSLYSPRVAEDITMTGKHFTVLIDRAINNFFVHWADEENYQKNLELIQTFYPDVTNIVNFTEYEPDTVNDLCIYGDTDSRYIRIDYIYKLIGKPFPTDDNELARFGEFLDTEYFAKIIKQSIDEDCDFRNARKGYMKMGHEVTARRCTFIKKKKYMMNVIWEDGKFLKKPKLKFRGVELRRGSMSEKAKKILNMVVLKYMQDGLSVDEIRTECLKVIKYIKIKKDKNLIYQISSVSGLNNIELKDGYYVSDKSHIQMQLACSWLNFIKQKHLEDMYQPPFEGQKMQFYYCQEGSGYKVIGIPDDVDINTVRDLPEPDWNKMILISIIKPLCRYILNKEDVTDKDVEYFLMGVKSLNF